MIFNVFRKSETHKILTPEALERALLRGSDSSSGVSVTPATAAAFGAVFACVQVRAESLGQLPMHMYERKGERSKKKAVDHPLYRLLHHAPNEGCTAQEFWEWVSACLDLHGNAYAFINWVNGRPYELLQLSPNDVQVGVTKSRDIFYKVTTPEGPKSYGPKEILHIKRMSLDGYTGASIIAQARETIGLAMALEKHGAKFFKNGGAPGGVLRTDKVLGDKEYEALVESWEESHGGLDNAHRVAILEAGLQWQNIGMPLKDIQFLEGRKFSRTEIAGLFRVPPHMIGDLERATFTNIEQQGLEFIIHGMVPTLTRCERRCWMQLLTEEEQKRFYMKFSTNGLARGDMAARGAFYNLMIQNGVYSPNDVREYEDLDARDGGDIYLTPMNMLIDGKQPAAPAKPSPDDKPQEDDE